MQHYKTLAGIQVAIHAAQHALDRVSDEIDERVARLQSLRETLAGESLDAALMSGGDFERVIRIGNRIALVAANADELYQEQTSWGEKLMALIEREQEIHMDIAAEEEEEEEDLAS